MIHIREIITYIMAKVNKGFAWCIFLGLSLPCTGIGQAENIAIYKAKTREITLHSKHDSMDIAIASIPLDKSFFAQLNHEKKRKKKTVYYRLAKFAAPIDVHEVPIVIGNNNIQLHLQGTLQGDTSAQFACIVYAVDNGWELEIKLPAISVNQFSLCINRLFACTIFNLEGGTLIRQKAKNEKMYISLHGNAYRIFIRYPFHKTM